MKTLRSLISAAGLAAFAATGAAQAQDNGLFIYVSPDPIGVNAFLQLGQTGTERAGEMFDAEVQTFESSTAAARLDNVNAAVNEGADIIVLLGFEFNDIVAQLAPTTPDIEYLIVDQCIENRPDNVHCAVFREYEASYLVGVAAAMLTENDRVGVVGALDIPFLHRYTDGYAQGAKSVNEDIEVDVRWVGGENPFADPVRAKEQAVAIHGAGADVIFTATAGGDFGVFEAARENDFKAFSVDVDWCAEAPGLLVDSTLKRVDNAIVQAIEQILAGEDQIFTSLGLAEGGMSLVALEDESWADSECLVTERPELVEAITGVAEMIESGELELEDPMFAQ